MMISGIWPTQLNNSVSFRWSKQGFRYLGIIITPNPTQLFEANYNKLIKQIKNDVARWEIMALSLLGRIETVKMNLLPRLLFLFQSLPIGVPVATLKMLDRLVSTFIWQKKRPRIRLKSLHLPKDKGGLGLPNLKSYYWAAQISATVAWIRKDQETIWTTGIRRFTNGQVNISIFATIFLILRTTAHGTFQMSTGRNQCFHGRQTFLHLQIDKPL